MTNQQFPVSGAGLGLRREKLDEMLASDLSAVDFMEVAPEIWINVVVLSVKNSDSSLKSMILSVTVYHYLSVAHRH